VGVCTYEMLWLKSIGTLTIADVRSWWSSTW